MLTFHHIGIACKDIDKMREWVKSVHDIVSEQEPIFDEQQDATVCMLTCRDGLNIELISGERVKEVIKKNINLYHICYSVKNIQEAIENMQKANAMVFSSPKEAILFGGKKVAFLYTPMGVVELVEE